MISERQKEIIDAAGRILTESGIGGLTTKKLALEMGFSEAAIYRHFPACGSDIGNLCAKWAQPAPNQAARPG